MRSAAGTDQRGQGRLAPSAEGQAGRPRPNRAAFWAYAAIWAAALALAVVATIAGVLHHIATFPDGSRKWLLLSLWLLPTLFNVATASLLMLSRHRNVVAAVLSLSLLLFAATDLLAGNFWANLMAGDLRSPAYLAVIVLSNAAWFGLMLTFLIFPDGAFTTHRAKAVAAAAAAFQIWITYRRFSGAPEYSVQIEILSALVETGFFVLCIAALARRFRDTPAGLERQQIRWVLFGLVPGTLFILAWAGLTLVAPVLGDLPRDRMLLLGSLGGISLPIGFACIALGFLVALLRYRLYDADRAISRSAAYALLTVLAGILFIAVEQGLEALLMRSLPDRGMRDFAAAALVLVALTPLRSAVTRWFDRRLRKPLAELRAAFPEYLMDLREALSMEELFEEAARWIDRGVRPARMAAAVDGRLVFTKGTTPEETAQWLAAARADAGAEDVECRPEDSLFPVRIALRTGTGGEPLGWLYLGSRPDRSLYGKEELGALAGIAGPMARAIKVVRLREQRAMAMEEVKRAPPPRPAG